MSDEAMAAVKSADRVLDLFELLARWGHEMTHAEIASALGIPKSSLSKLLKNLGVRGYLEYLPATKGYRLGPALAQLSRRATHGRDIVELAGGVLAQIMAATQESCSLSLLRGDEIEAVAAVDCPQPLLSHLRVGDRVPLYASSGGKAILAFLPDSMREDYLARASFRPLTPHTLRAQDALRREIEEIRRDGASYSRQEVTVGVVSIGVPVLSAAGHPLAALNVAMPTVRFDEGSRRRCIHNLKQGAERLRSLAEQTS